MCTYKFIHFILTNDLLSKEKNQIVLKKNPKIFQSHSDTKSTNKKISHHRPKSKKKTSHPNQTERPTTKQANKTRKNPTTANRTKNQKQQKKRK